MAEYPALDLRFPRGPEAARVEAVLHATLDDFQPIAIQEHDSADGWLVFFRDAEARDDANLAVVPLIGTMLLSSTSVDVPDEDWARRSQANLTAISVGRITIAPPWDAQQDAGLRPPQARAADADPTAGILIVIDPSMGFGTGHHQTTRLCLRLLQRQTLLGRRVVDVGTGSGVLALAAWALGADSVVAIDHDPDAIQNARENIDRNGATGAIEVASADLSAFIAPPADIATANLTAAVLIHHVAALRRLVVPGAVLIASGFSPAEVPDVLTAFGVVDNEPVVEDDWAAVLINM